MGASLYSAMAKARNLDLNGETQEQGGEKGKGKAGKGGSNVAFLK